MFEGHEAEIKAIYRGKHLLRARDSMGNGFADWLKRKHDLSIGDAEVAIAEYERLAADPQFASFAERA